MNQTVYVYVMLAGLAVSTVLQGLAISRLRQHVEHLSELHDRVVAGIGHVNATNEAQNRTDVSHTSSVASLSETVEHQEPTP
jgi:hypothetical protein